MRILVLVMGVSIFAVGMGARAEAQNYPWCAQYSGRAGGMNCGFVSFEQCMATVTGIGGFVYEITHIDRFIIRIDRDTDAILIEEISLTTRAAARESGLKPTPALFLAPSTMGRKPSETVQ